MAHSAGQPRSVDRDPHEPASVESTERCATGIQKLHGRLNHLPAPVLAGALDPPAIIPVHVHPDESVSNLSVSDVDRLGPIDVVKLGRLLDPHTPNPDQRIALPEPPTGHPDSDGRSSLRQGGRRSIR